ncbi:hypothetical protein D3C71_1439890 [compost metagenome]
MVRQLRPEQQAQAHQAHGPTAEHVAGDFLTEEDPRIHRVPQRRGREHHGNQAAGDPLAGGQETHEVDAEQTQPLGQADQVAAAVHRLQAAGKQEDGKQDQASQGEAVDDGDRNRDHAQLQLQGDPGGAPDQHCE